MSQEFVKYVSADTLDILASRVNGFVSAGWQISGSVIAISAIDYFEWFSETQIRIVQHEFVYIQMMTMK